MNGEIVDKINLAHNTVELLNEMAVVTSKTHPASDEEAARTAFVSLMALFEAVKQLVKDRMLIEQIDELRPLHLRLLCLCVEQPGGTQQQLADLTGRDKGQVAHLIRSLEARGLMVRTPDSLDGRILRMGVTPAGAAAAHRFMAMETELAHHLFGELTAVEVNHVQTLLRHLTQRATALGTSVST